MRYKYGNIFTKLETELTISHGDDNITMYVKKVVGGQPSNPKSLARMEQFDLLTKYLDYRGTKLKDSLYTLYLDAYNKAGSAAFSIDDAKGIMVRAANMLDLNDVERWVRGSGLIRVPEHLPREYVEVKGSNNTREQTYTIDDYWRLIPVYVFSKMMIPIIGELSLNMGHFKNMGKGQELKTLMEYILDSDNNVSKSPAIVKLLDILDFMINVRTAQLDDMVLKKYLSTDRIPTYLLSNIVFKRLSILVIYDDNKTANIITHSYNVVNDVLQKKPSTVADITPTTPSADDQSSIFESIQQATTYTPGDIQGMNWAIDNDDGIVAKQLDIDLIEYRKNIDKFKSLLHKGYIPEASIIIASWVMMPVIHPDCIRLMNGDNVIRCLAATYTYLKPEYNEIAVLISSYVRDSNEAVVEGTRNILTLPNGLNELFTIRKRPIRENSEDKLILIDTIKMVTDEYVGFSLHTVLEVGRGQSNHIRPVGNLRNKIAELILHLNKE